MKTIDVGNDFYHRLANRDPRQGDGKYTAIDFRTKYLDDLDNEEAWKEETPFICLDFKNVKKIGPSFANEAFAYFTQYANPKQIAQRIQLINTSIVSQEIITAEIERGYKNV